VRYALMLKAASCSLTPYCNHYHNNYHAIRQDAVRYALMLKAMEFHSPSPQEQDVRELKEFCIGAAVGLQLVPTGAGLTPPEANKVYTVYIHIYT
jgi:Protein of unknown function (DUF3110)